MYQLPKELTKSQIQEFKAIYFKQFGKNLSDTQAEVKAKELVVFIANILLAGG